MIKQIGTKEKRTKTLSEMRLKYSVTAKERLRYKTAFWYNYPASVIQQMLTIDKRKTYIEMR